MEIARPQLLPEPETSADPARMLLDEEVVGAAFRGVGFGALVRELLSVQGCRFTGCSFAGSVLGHSQFSDVLFRNCDFSNVDLQGCSFHRVEFADCKLTGTGLAETTLNHLLFDRCKGEFANFAFSRLRTVRFAGCRMRSAAFGDCRFERVEFAQCELAAAEFFGTRLRGVCVRRFGHPRDTGPRNRLLRTERREDKRSASRRTGPSAGRRDRGVNRSSAKCAARTSMEARAVVSCGACAYLRPIFLRISLGTPFLLTSTVIVL